MTDEINSIDDAARMIDRAENNLDDALVFLRQYEFNKFVESRCSADSCFKDMHKSITYLINVALPALKVAIEENR